MSYSFHIFWANQVLRYIYCVWMNLGSEYVWSKLTIHLI